jgi:hypothetical protein
MEPRIAATALPGSEGTVRHTQELAVCRTNSTDFLLIIPLTNRDHQVQLGAARKMVDLSLTIRSVVVQFLHYLLIQTDDHDVWPNVEFIATSHRMRLVWYPEAAVHI